ncbi:nucleotide-diphospho-sugar transferase [Aspergillus multicolor]|uniref:nucleotide-diphospho-sugar transferase n=1 Tax=Aspergillus multicolor TaxID=41759 RepID=UPI003CCE30B1
MDDRTDGTRFVYVQYANDLEYLCNAAINFARLDRFGAHFDRVLIHPEEWNEAVPILSTASEDATWRNSLTKFYAFDLTEYTRVLAFDSDALILNAMDHYFLAPNTPVAVPRAYWLEPSEENGSMGRQILASHVMLIKLNERIFSRIMDEARASGDFDMEVLNHLFSETVMILPHRRIALLTGEFQKSDHSLYLSDDPDGVQKWNVMAEVSRAYLFHFSDWPLPKPWRSRSKEQWEEALPGCDEEDVVLSDRPRCADRVMWMGFYEDYEIDGEGVCRGII